MEITLFQRRKKVVSVLLKKHQYQNPRRNLLSDIFSTKLTLKIISCGLTVGSFLKLVILESRKIRPNKERNYRKQGFCLWVVFIPLTNILKVLPLPRYAVSAIMDQRWLKWVFQTSKPLHSFLPIQNTEIVSFILRVLNLDFKKYTQL